MRCGVGVAQGHCDSSCRIEVRGIVSACNWSYRSMYAGKASSLSNFSSAPVPGVVPPNSEEEATVLWRVRFGKVANAVFHACRGFWWEFYFHFSDEGRD